MKPGEQIVLPNLEVLHLMRPRKHTINGEILQDILHYRKNRFNIRVCRERILPVTLSLIQNTLLK